MRFTDDFKLRMGRNTLAFDYLEISRQQDLYMLVNKYKITGNIKINYQPWVVESMHLFENFTHHLDLQYNRITDISSLSHMTCYLYLGGNQICDISPLKNMTHQLDLVENLVIDVSPLKNMTHHLGLGGNKITDI